VLTSGRRSVVREANTVDLWSVWPARSVFRPRRPARSAVRRGWLGNLKVRVGDRVAVVDSNGVTWFGVAMSGVEPGPLWPSVRVLLATGVSWYPQRDVSLWPTPETLAGRDVANRDVYWRPFGTTGHQCCYIDCWSSCDRRMPVRLCRSLTRPC
jgi:hypothetical protein